MKPYWRIKKNGKWTWVPAIRVVGTDHPSADWITVYKPSFLGEEE